MIDELHKRLAEALRTAKHALRSYQYGNAATALAEATADFADKRLADYDAAVATESADAERAAEALRKEGAA